MASTLTNVALSTIRAPHASYYGDINENNPVISAAEKEIKEVLSYFSKKKNAAPAKNHEACSRGSNWLFEVWNKYEPRLPLQLFYAKLIEVGDSLRQRGVNDVANWQCYQRYLKTRYGKTPNELTFDAYKYREAYFYSDQENDDIVLTCKALLGMYMSEYNSLHERDPNLLASESLSQCQDILKGLRTFMQCLLSHEQLFWMLYNCSIIVYKICRVMMSSGYSVKVLEFLLWSAMCMEMSVPLLGVKYLQWRVTLYSAICLAYYDCKADHHAEDFARRGLSKLQQLSELERLSDSSENRDTQFVFRQATAKMASMIFKRSVYETRRKPKGVLRPKVKNNLKEAAQLAWPRTLTERLLGEMFEGSAAQFIAILEALSSSHRRTLQHGPQSSDIDMLDVTAELFFAGKEIIAGGGGRRGQIASGADHSVLAGIKHDRSLVDMAGEGIDGVTLNGVVRFIKLAFCYEQWSTFNTLLDCALICMKKTNETMHRTVEAEHSGTEICLALLLVMERVARSRSQKKLHPNPSTSGLNSAEETLEIPPTQGSVRSVVVSDDLINLAETVLYCISDPSFFAPQDLDGDPLIDRDMIVDAALLLWQKCRIVFGRIQSGTSYDMAAALQRSGNPGKWLHILSIVHSAFVWSGIGSVDPVVMAEVCLRLALALETAAVSDLHGSRFNEDPNESSRLSQYSPQISPNSQLGSALHILADGLKSISDGRSNMAAHDAQRVADVSWMKETERLIENKIPTSDALICDLHVEMLVVHHRIALKLVDKSFILSHKQSVTHASNTAIAPESSRFRAVQPTVLTEANIKDRVGGCLVSRAIFLIQKADQLMAGDPKVEKLLSRAVTTIQHAEQEEKRLFEDSLLRLHNPYDDGEDSHIPAPPILLSRSDTSMTFKPAPFSPVSDKVAWYRVYGRLAAGANVKVRLNDYFLPGTGDEVPAGEDCLLRVDGLEPNQRYVFAVAAYSSTGQLIGGSVGRTGHSVVACHPLSILSAWGHLAQVSYKLGALQISQQACNKLWKHFVKKPPQPPRDTWTSTARRDFNLTLYHLNRELALETSSVLLRHVMSAIFVAVETAIQHDSLHCDRLCNEGPLMSSQIARLRQCERMLVAMEIAGWLNDPSSLLQAVVQTYGLIAPIIQAEVCCTPVLQVAARCHSALQEISTLIKQKRSTVTTESLNHLVAVLTNYVATGSMALGKSQVALSTIDSGKQLLRNERAGLASSEANTETQTSPIKRSRSRKQPLAETYSNFELNALVERLAEISRESRAADELTGGEDSAAVLARLSKMRPIVAYRELGKFRRRSRFLEFFVFVLHRAMRLQQTELAIEWAAEVCTFLQKRNDALAVNRSLVSHQPGGTAVQGEDARKYAATIAEYSEPKKNKNNALKRQKQREKQKKFLMMRKRSGRNLSDEQQEEREIKALSILDRVLVDVHHSSLKRRKLRKVTTDELPWRSQYNHLVGLLHYDVLMSRLKGRNRLKGIKIPLSETASFLDQDLWSYDNCGAIVVGWNDGSRPTGDQHLPDPHNFNIRALEKAAYLAVTTSLVSEPAEPTVKEAQTKAESKGFDTPRTLRTASPISLISNLTTDPEVAAMQPTLITEAIKVCMISFRRALVLANRGRLWTLLQNVARSLHSCVNSIFQALCGDVEPILTVAQLRELMWKTVSMAADLLLDMLVQRQDKPSNDKWPVNNVVGDLADVKGGASLKFQPVVDDTTSVDVILVKKLVFHALQMLHFETRWEQLVDICLRFSAVTHDCYYDAITPVLIHAQAKIKERISKYGGEKHPQKHFLKAAEKLRKTKLRNSDYMRYNLKVVVSKDVSPAIGIGGFIDPASHDVYGGGKRALALSCVPFDPKQSMDQIREAFAQSQYTSRALSHSRRLLSIYLSSQHNLTVRSRRSSAKIDSNSSVVEFTTKPEEPQSTAPTDITKLDFTSTDVLELISSSQLSTVIQSYNRTIELLISHGQRDLVAQASNELAALYWHQGNLRAANKWWMNALDQILKMKNSLYEWKQSIKDVDNIPEELLSRCGIWGCLLGITLTSKIGEFVASDVKLKQECALLGAELVRAIFRSSLPHPTADFDYASYEIASVPAENAQKQGATKSKHDKTEQAKPTEAISSAVQSNILLSGIDLFSDRFRCDIQTMVASLHWLCDSLVSMKYCSQALPALTFYQYLATFSCRDVQRSVQCRCLKLTALIELRMFREAMMNAIYLVFGTRLPHPCDAVYAAVDVQPPVVTFDPSKSVDDVDNLKAMEVLASKRVSSALAARYGPQLTCEVTLGQALLLTHLAECIPLLPQKPTVQDLRFVSPDIQAELQNIQQQKSRNASARIATISGQKNRRQSHAQDDTRSNFSGYSAASGTKDVNKLFTNRDIPMGQQLVKGMLLAVAENLATTMTKTLESSEDEQLSSEVWLLVKGYYLLSEIQQQRQLSTLSAARAFSALETLKDSSIFLEKSVHVPRKLRSALRKKKNEDGEDEDAKVPETYFETYEVVEQMYRCRLNARLWLDCRYRLCQALTTQLKGLGKVGDAPSETAGLLDHSQVQLYCAEGLAEAEACADLEMQALFLLQGSLLDGISGEESKHMLEDALSSLDEQAELSSRAVLGLVECTTRLTDLSLLTNSMSASESMESYRSAQSVVLFKAMKEGATITHSQSGGDLSSPELPLKNLFASHTQLLAHIKLRLAHSLSQTISPESFDDYQTVAQLLIQAQKLCSRGVAYEVQLLAEIHLKLGKIQRLSYYLSTDVDNPKEAMLSLQEAAKLSEPSIDDLPTSRIANLEMALLDMHYIEKRGFGKIRMDQQGVSVSESPLSKAPRSVNTSNNRSFSLDLGVVSMPLDITSRKSRIAKAMYSAFHMSRSMKSRAVLPGNPQVTSLTFSSEDKSSLPDFVILDLCSDHLNLPPPDLTSDDIITDPVLTSVRANASGLSWIHILLYDVLLQRKSRLYSSIVNDSIYATERKSETEDMSTKDHALQTTVRTPLNSSSVPLRISALHEYLSRLPSYAATCHIPTFPSNKNYMTVQWYDTDDGTSVQLLWCIVRTGGPIECSHSDVYLGDLERVSRQAASLKKKTDEFFGRTKTKSDSSQQRRKSRAKLQPIDSELEDEWKHLVNQVIDLLSSTNDEPITQLPFEITMVTAQSIVELVTIGCYFEKSHPLHQWLVKLLTPC